VQGIWESYKDFRPHFITLATEHSAMLEAFRKIEGLGAEVDFLKVDREGRVSIDEIEHNIIEGRTCMISVMLANNETGVIQDIKAISKIARIKGALMMSDTTQAIGKIEVDIQKLGIDIACVSGHKIYGPKGAGALYLRRKQPRVHLMPIIVGGGHEKGIRAGSLNVPGIVGLGKACELIYDELKQREKHFFILRNCLLGRLKGHKEIAVLGSKHKLINTLFLSLGKRKASDFIKLNQSKLALSLGSACDSANEEGSHVLIEMGLSKEEIRSSVRISFGIYNNLYEVEFLADRIIDFCT
jgi:cysteine desulfurase